MNPNESQTDTNCQQTSSLDLQESNLASSSPLLKILPENSSREITETLKEDQEKTNGETTSTSDETNALNTPPAHINNLTNSQQYWHLVPNYYQPSVYPPNTPIFEPGPHWQQLKQDRLPPGAYIGPYHEGQVPYENFNYQNINYAAYPQQQHAYSCDYSLGVIDYNTVPWPSHNILPHQPIPINVHAYQPQYEGQASSKSSSSSNSKVPFNYEDYYSKDKIRASGGLSRTNGSGGMAYHVAPNDPLFYSNDHNNNNNYYPKIFGDKLSPNNQYYKHASTNGSHKGFLNRNKKNESTATGSAENESRKTKRYSDIVSGKQKMNSDSFSNNSGSEKSETLKDEDVNNNNLENNNYITKNKNKHVVNSSYYKNQSIYPSVYYPNLLNNMMNMSLASDYNIQRPFKPYKNTTYQRSNYYKQANNKTDVDYDRYDPKDFRIPNELGEDRSSRFFVIKSYSKDDIIKSIKYNIWCSTEDGNRKLDKAFSETQNGKNSAVYLFFSVNGSGQFCGVAQMLSRIDYDSKSKIWSQDKWHGTFDINWIFVKDVPNLKLRHILLHNNESKPVTNSRDTQEVEFDEACEVLNIIRQHYRKSSILDEFDNNEIRKF